MHFHLQMLGLRKRWNEDTAEAALRPRSVSTSESVMPASHVATIAALQKEVEGLKSQLSRTKSTEVSICMTCD